MSVSKDVRNSHETDELSQTDLGTIAGIKNVCFQNATLDNKGLLNRILKHFFGRKGILMLSQYDRNNAQANFCLQYLIRRIPDIINLEYVPIQDDR